MSGTGDVVVPDVGGWGGDCLWVEEVGVCVDPAEVVGEVVELRRCWVDDDVGVEAWGYVFYVVDDAGAAGAFFGA